MVRPTRPPRHAGRHNQFDLSSLRDAWDGAWATIPVRPGRISQRTGLKVRPARPHRSLDRLELTCLAEGKTGLISRFSVARGAEGTTGLNSPAPTAHGAEGTTDSLCIRFHSMLDFIKL